MMAGTPMTRRQRKKICHRLKQRYGPAITIEGQNGEWHANILHVNTPILRMLLAS